MSTPAPLNIEVDGKPVQVPHGSTVMDATNKLGVYVPHFCYHKKLSIAANCRMCLVHVEKAPKPLPACATPATEGMKVWTHSEQAVNAQKGVMEFLLINHPLDCPICDQGGECQLQDLAVGYGASESRYAEPKRVVFQKNLGPLISAAEMTRCIHCTRCVRFGQEIAGVMELGLVGRGEHAEIVSFVGQTVDSELSGNMIDLCPVGALTSKPFRYSARTWELARRKSVAPHDSLGSNVIVQVKGNRVMRVLPLENEAINECWLSDRDRFSYEGLDNGDRLTTPMINDGGTWREVDWTTALERVATGLRDIAARHGAESIGALVSPTSTLEELALAARLVRGLGSDNVDYRLRHTDFRDRDARTRWLGFAIPEIARFDRVLVVGSFLRNDHPLFAHRLRQAAKKKTRVIQLNAVDENWLMPVAHKAIVPPSLMPSMLADIVAAVAHAAGKSPPEGLGAASGEPNAAAQVIASELLSGERKAILLGTLAEQHPEASQLHALAQSLAQMTGATLGFMREAANSVGADIAMARPREGGFDARRMLDEPRRAYLLVNAEAEFDFAHPVAARSAFERADLVVVMSPFRHGTAYADVLLPVSPFTETSGTFVNCEGRAQSFRGVVPPLGETRPAWKVLRVLGSMLGLPGFDFDSSEQVRDSVLPAGENAIAALLDNTTNAAIASPARTAHGIERVADVPLYFADALVRRSEPLQLTADARPPRARVHRSLLDALGAAEGAQLRVRQGRGEAVVKAVVDPGIPAGVIRLASAHASTCSLDGMCGPVSVERA